jgi:hypothetical protein
MINAPVFGWLNIAAINAFVGTRIYPFGDAPQDPTAPYITYLVVSSVSQNYHGETPNTDNQRVQIDIWSRDQQETLDIGTEVQTAMDARGYQSLMIGPRKEPDTQIYRLQFDYSIWLTR